VTVKEFLIKYAEAAEQSGGVSASRANPGKAERPTLNKIRSRGLKNKLNLPACPLEMAAMDTPIGDILVSSKYLKRIIVTAADWEAENHTAVRAWRGVLLKVGSWTSKIIFS